MRCALCPAAPLQAFYEAGVAYREAGLANMAFVLLNRYLDLTEAMEEPDGSTMLENADFADTDIPHDFHLPEHHYVEEDAKEEIRDWVLAVSMDQQVRWGVVCREDAAWCVLIKPCR